MTISDSPALRSPSVFHSSVCFATVILIIATGLFWLGIDLHVLMFICLIWTGANAYMLGCSYLEIRQFMSEAIARALPAIYIFILIGMVIASFMHAGTIAALMYYGLSWISPGLFLPLGMLLCAFMSVATGTSWGTVGTLGVVFIGIGGAMGMPLPLVAGMVVCGATFGDKMSPVSDTTNLAAMSAGTNLYRHIYSMMFTTIPTFLLVLVIFSVIGLGYRESQLASGELGSIQNALAESYRLAPVVTFIPIIVLALLSVLRIAAEVSMTASILSAVAIAVVFQGGSPTDVLNALWANSPGNTGIASLDDLLGRGGIVSMSWTLLLALMALALGGIMHSAGFLRSLLAGLIARVKHVAALVASTIGSGLIGNMAMGEAYISIILNCQLFRDKYSQEGLDSAILSRSVEEGSTMTTGLIPWTTAGAFYTATLGIPVLEYAPYAFFNYLNAAVAIAMATLGLGLLGKTPQQSVTD